MYIVRNMTYGWILILFLFKGYTESYFVSDVSSQWWEKDNICPIALPPIKHTESDITVEINSSLIETDDAWVGYIKAQRLFDYVGCFQQNSSNMIRLEDVRVGSPGQCFDLCNGSTLIGLSVNECFCTKDISSLVDLQSNYTKCTKECGDQSGVACGGQTENGTKYVSVYKDTQIEEKAINDTVDAHCLQLDIVMKTFIWTKCSKDLIVFCDFNGTCMSTSSEGINKPWIENANLCFSHGGSPMHSINCSRREYNNNTRSPVWTGFVRSYVISSDGNAPAETGIQYGFVQKQNGKVFLKFTNDSSERNLILCNNQKTLEENKDPNVLAFIMITVAACLVIVVMIFTTLLLDRRKYRQRQKRNNVKCIDNHVSFIDNERYVFVDDNTDHNQVNDDMEDNQGRADNVASRKELYKSYSAYDCKKPGVSITDDDLSRVDHTVHNYYVLEKQVQEDTHSNYDSTRLTRKINRDGDAKIYNTLAFDTEQTYDHAFQIKRNIDPSSSSAYSTVVDVYSCREEKD